MSGRVVVLTGGVGGAKLVLGLMQILPPSQITAIVNTADDFRHFGLAVSPDLDTLLDTLAGMADPVQGWGRRDETLNFMNAARSLGGEDWFLLGDGDLALHVLRTHWLASGSSLSEVTRQFTDAWSVETSILPMSNDSVATLLETDEGDLSFQEYFVKRRCEPIVHTIRFDGADKGCAAPGVLDAISSPATKAILIAPSNPWLSIDPILAVPAIREALLKAAAPIVAVSPIVGGKSVKGPTAKLMSELGLAITNKSIADHYGELLNGLLIDYRDDAQGMTIAHSIVDTLMHTLADRSRVAAAALALAAQIGG